MQRPDLRERPETLFNAGISYKFYQASGWLQAPSRQLLQAVPDPRAGARRPLQRRDVDRHAVRRRHPGRDRRPGQPDAGQQPEAGASRRTAPTACCPTCRSSGPAPSTSTRRPSRRPAPSSSPPSWRPWPPTRTCGTAPCSSSTTTRTTGSSTTSSRRRPNTRSSPRSSSPWPRRPAPPAAACPIGAGFRVPAFVISPWTVGGRIFSEVSDHTSCLRLIEAVAAAGGLSGAGPVTFPNISRWRRARPSATSPGPCARARRRRPRPAPSSTPPPRRPTWPPSRRPPCSRCRRAPARPSRCRRADHRRLGTRGERAGRQGGVSPSGPGGYLREPSRPGGIVVPETVSHSSAGGTCTARSGRLRRGRPGHREGVRAGRGRLAADINQAVLAAQAALETGPWPGMAAPERARVLHGIADAIDARADDIAAAEALGPGLPVTQAREQAARAARSSASPPT